MTKLEKLYNRIESILEDTKEAHLNRNIDKKIKNLKNVCLLIDECVKITSNIAKTAFEIESICLVYDRGINLGVRMESDTNKIDARMTGCMSALMELHELQSNPEDFYKTFKKFQPYNDKADTIYTKEAFNTNNYLGKEKRGNETYPESYELYEKRQQVLGLGRKDFLNKKQQTFEKFRLTSKQNNQNKNKDKGIQR